MLRLFRCNFKFAPVVVVFPFVRLLVVVLFNSSLFPKLIRICIYPPFDSSQYQFAAHPLPAIRRDSNGFKFQSAPYILIATRSFLLSSPSSFFVFALFSSPRRLGICVVPIYFNRRIPQLDRSTCQPHQRHLPINTITLTDTRTERRQTSCMYCTASIRSLRN